MSIYHSKSDEDSTDILGWMGSRKIILTTFTEVMNSLPKINLPKEPASLEDLQKYEQEVGGKKGTLHRV